MAKISVKNILLTSNLHEVDINDMVDFQVTMATYQNTT